MAFENPGVDTEKLLVEPSKPKPKSQKGFDGKHDLEAAHSVRSDFAKDFDKHINTCSNSNEKRIGNDFANMHHDRLSGFCLFVRRKRLAHFDKKEVVDKKEAAIDKGCIEVNNMHKIKHM